MKKVVVNDAFGSCYLSFDALYLLIRLGFPVEATPLAEMGRDEAEFDVEGPDGYRGMAGDYSTALFKDGLVYHYPWSRKSAEYQALRSHPALVKMAELLGPRATRGRFGRLGLVEIADDARYRITDYDGAEGVHVFSPDDYVDGQVYQELEAPVVPATGWFES